MADTLPRATLRSALGYHIAPRWGFNDGGYARAAICKLITRDTVEEKILKLQQKKRDAIQAVFGDETALTETLTWEEVQELLG